MSRRYSEQAKLLDLSNFRGDQAFQSKELFITLTRPNVATFAMKTITEHIIDLVILDLSSNNLEKLEHLSVLKACKNLKAINLAKNKVSAKD